MPTLLAIHPIYMVVNKELPCYNEARMFPSGAGSLTGIQQAFRNIYTQFCQFPYCTNCPFVFGRDSAFYHNMFYLRCCIEFGEHENTCFLHSHGPKNVLLKEMHIL